jgi:alkylation response protein AidB-like acyl-CoA dehydrogenase
MPAPLINAQDLEFILFDMLDVEQVCAYPRFADHSRETITATLETARRIAEEKFQPHNRAADLAEPHLENGKVVLLDEVAQAISAFNEAGFAAAHHDFERGGMQLPWTVAQAAFTYFQTANISTVAYPFLTVAAANLIDAHGDDTQKQRYMMPMLEGRFFGTMMLSEPHAGSSLSDVRTAARSVGDGTYKINGSKMWISGGEHEMAENIIHLVLARIEGAPAGVKGLSLFVVPRYRLDAAGKPGAPNNVRLVGLNHKMGYRGTVNTAINLGEAGDCIGELIGAENRGLTYMFHMMNEARIGVGVSAAMLAYAGYRESLEYARERPQGRHPGEKDPTAPQVPLIKHADIRRLLLRQKTVAEGGLVLGLYAARLVDQQRNDADETVRGDAGLLLDVLTPIIKSWLSDEGLAANEAAIQVLGGAGYTRDFSVEQHYRDNRLNPIHEGANGIQAIDLLGRKVGMLDGRAFDLLTAEIEQAIDAARPVEGLAEHAEALAAALGRVKSVTAELLSALERDGARTGLANATAYMEMLGRLVMAWIWLRQATVAAGLLAKGDAARDNFLRGKLQACRYVFRWDLPRLWPVADLLEKLDGTVGDMRDAWF